MALLDYLTKITRGGLLDPNATPGASWRTNPVITQFAASMLGGGGLPDFAAKAPQAQLVAGAQMEKARKQAAWNVALKAVEAGQPIPPEVAAVLPEVGQAIVARSLTTDEPKMERDQNKVLRYTTGPHKGEEVFPGIKGNEVSGAFPGMGPTVQGINEMIASGQITKEQGAQWLAGKAVIGPDGQTHFITPENLFGAPDGMGGTSLPKPLFDPTVGKDTDTMRSNRAAATQAARTLEPELDRFVEMVGKTGIEAMPGPAKDSLNIQRQGLMLQLKELFNLGVLNGPDLSLMEKMIFDPSVDMTKEGGLSNLPGQLGSAVAPKFFGSPKERAKNSADQIKLILRDRLKSFQETIPQPQPPASGASSEAAPAAPLTLTGGAKSYRDYFP